MAVAVEPGVPALLNHQGRLFDAKGRPVSGHLDFHFSIYDRALEGSPLYSETQPIELEDGRYSTQIGLVNPIPVNLFDGRELFLGVAIDDDEEL
ncbi:MAG TPA: hypothetical protein VGD74_03480, partial [Vulgatibacter sp.]